jgi:non-specific serine/threonine protein kinase
MMATFDGRFDDARREAEALHKLAGQGAHLWGAFEVAFAVCTRDLDRLRSYDPELARLIGGHPVLDAWMACVDALLGRPDAAHARLAKLVELPPGLPTRLAIAQAAVLLGSAELAEKLYDPLLEVSTFGRFFFCMGPTSRLLGELALLRGDHARARDHFDAAIAECRAMEAAPFSAMCEEGRARVGGHTAPKPQPEESIAIAREGDVWSVRTSARSFRVKHAKGMEYLDHLLRNPDREVYVLALAGAGEGPEDAGAMLDDKAKQQYERRIEELEDQLTEAERNNDRGRANRARAELEAVAEQLASAVGLGGRDRKAASNVERARVNVQRRLKDAIKRIGEHDASLGRYLDATLRTGTYCVYRPV